MSSEPARYDAIADWYVEFTKDWDSEPFALLPDDLAGQRVLDLACGYGPAGRYLARRQARVTGLDISAGLLSRARQLEAGQPLGIRYVHGDASSTAWWDGVPYDGVLCTMALMDIDDLGGTLSTYAFDLPQRHPASRPGAGGAGRAGCIGPGQIDRPLPTARTALIYLHGSDERQRAIADAISKRVSSESGPQRPKRSGTYRAHNGGLCHRQ